MIRLSYAFLAALLISWPVGAMAQTEQPASIVLVHGAFVDGSGWKPVYDILTKDGYEVLIVQNPTRTLEDDCRDHCARHCGGQASGRPGGALLWRRGDHRSG